MVSKWLRHAAFRRTLFGGVVVLLTCTVAWLGWRLLSQDEQLASQRLADDREAAADLVVAAFEQRLAAIERDLDSALTLGTLPRPMSDNDGAVVLSTADNALRTWPEHVLRYYPQMPARVAVPEADSLVERAQASLKAGRFADALAAYDRLEELGGAPIGDVVGGIPAALFVNLGRMVVHERQGTRNGALTAARRLSESLRSAQWPVSAATYEFLEGETRRLLPDRAETDSELVLAEAVIWLWEQRASDPAFASSGRVSRLFTSGPAVLAWRSSPDTLAAWVSSQRSLGNVWLPAIGPILEPRRARVSITTADGQRILGDISPQDRPAVRLASATALPWTIQITNTADDGALKERRRLLLAAMAVLVALIVGGAWLIERTVARELAVADLQSDFVSAVSHEFRTPLTTLCQLSELLVRDRVATDQDRRQYYELMHGESQRLRRLVETLLNFGRLESGRMEFRFNDVDVGALVRRTIDEFSTSHQARGHRVELAADDGTLCMRADEEVLRTAVWNLLENAAKYSPGSDTIWVTLRRDGAQVTLSVRDRGVGIPHGEQRKVFEKFVRGAGARASDVGGTGVGLAMARRIVEAHGGEISLESAPGMGSTFTVVLPLVDSQARADLTVGPYDGVEAAG